MFNTDKTELTTDQMEGVQPQTIIIRSVPTKTPTTIAVSTPLENAMLDDLYGDGDGGPRKRRRLTHLSPEEKLLRRKLKNRVAAQTARDRKKNQMSDLELKVLALERENQKLAEENNKLKAKSGTLHMENEALKERLSTIGCSPMKTEEGSGSAVSTDLLQQGKTLPVSYSGKTYAASMLTFSILKQEKTVNTNSTATVQLQSLPGFTATKPSNSAGTSVVGPSATELESLQELIQFDHVYYKTQPASKPSSQSSLLQIKPKQTLGPKCVQKVTENGLKNVKIIITSDNSKKTDGLNGTVQIPNVILDTKMLEKRKQVSLITPKIANEVIDVETLKLEQDDLDDLNFDLLNDLESILSQDCEGLSCSDNANLQSQENMIECTENVQKGQKRKSCTPEIAAIVDNLTADFPPSPTKSLYSVGDSDYVSDVPSPYSFSQTTGSPVMEDSCLLEEPSWEESFTELFPDLM